MLVFEKDGLVLSVSWSGLKSFIYVAYVVVIDFILTSIVADKPGKKKMSFFEKGKAHQNIFSFGCWKFDKATKNTAANVLQKEALNPNTCRLDDKDAIVFCPIDRNHKMPAVRLQGHLIKCAEKNAAKNFVICQFNWLHRVPASEMQYHLDYECLDRKENQDQITGVEDRARNGSFGFVRENRCAWNGDNGFFESDEIDWTPLSFASDDSCDEDGSREEDVDDYEIDVAEEKTSQKNSQSGEACDCDGDRNDVAESIVQSSPPLSSSSECSSESGNESDSYGTYTPNIDIEKEDDNDSANAFFDMRELDEEELRELRSAELKNRFGIKKLWMDREDVDNAEDDDEEQTKPKDSGKSVIDDWWDPPACFKGQYNTPCKDQKPFL